jgi:thioredoxin-related protein
MTGKNVVIAVAVLAIGALGYAGFSGGLCTNCNRKAGGTRQVSNQTAPATREGAAVPAVPTVATVSMARTAPDDGIFSKWEDAFATASREKKLVMVDVYTDWCGWCKRLDKDVYSDAIVKKEVAKYFTAVKLNAESDDMHTVGGKSISERQLAGSWQVTGYPTIMFVTPEGEIIQKIPGYVPAKDFTLALRFVGTGAYKGHDFQSWKQKQG